MTRSFEVHLFLANGQTDPVTCACPRAACGGFTKLLDDCPTHHSHSGDAPIMGFKSTSRCCPAPRQSASA